MAARYGNHNVTAICSDTVAARNNVTMLPAIIFTPLLQRIGEELQVKTYH